MHLVRFIFPWQLGNETPQPVDIANFEDISFLLRKEGEILAKSRGTGSTDGGGAGGGPAKNTKTKSLLEAKKHTRRERRRIQLLPLWGDG